MHCPRKMFRSFQFALNKCLVDHHLCGDIRQFALLPSFHLLSHRPEVSVHAVNAHCDAIDERERLRVFCEYRRKHAWDNASELNIGPAPYGFQLSIRRISDWHVHCPLKRRTRSRHLNRVNFEVQVPEPFSFLTFPFCSLEKLLRTDEF